MTQVQAPVNRKKPFIILALCLGILTLMGTNGFPFNSSSDWTGRNEPPKVPLKTESFEERFVRVIIQLDRKKVEQAGVFIVGINVPGGTHNFAAKNNYIHDYPAKVGSEVSVGVIRQPDNGGKIYCSAVQVGVPGNPDESYTAIKGEQALCQVVVV